MKKDTPEIRKKREREKEIVCLMIDIYCRKNHRELYKKDHHMCRECQNLFEYAAKRTDLCPFMETKTFCSECKVHCYAPEMKEKIRRVMKFSGPRIMLYHPVSAAKHLAVTLKSRLSK